MYIPDKLIKLEADMPYYADELNNVYYVLTSSGNAFGSFIPVKSVKDGLLNVNGHFEFDQKRISLDNINEGDFFNDVYIVDMLPALKDLRSGKYYPTTIAVHIKNVKCNEIKILSSEYICDQNNIYFSSVLIEGADIKSFYIFPDSLYSKDKNRVYYRNKVVRKANPDTFEIINHQFQKDDIHVWYMGSLLCADSSTFRVFSHNTTDNDKNVKTFYACDKDHVFYQYLILDDADIKTFRVLKSEKTGELYGVDEKRVFYHNIYLEYADAKTFHVLDKSELSCVFSPEIDAYDENYKFVCGNKIALTDTEKNILYAVNDGSS